MKQEIAREQRHTQAKMHVTGMPFASIPGQSELFLAYLSDLSSVAAFYPNLPHFHADPRKYADGVLSRYETDRSALCDALADINTGAGAGIETMANIALLREDDTVAVVTGQQAGLFTGPLYTIYKALSAIRLAERLNTEGTRAVPVFWIATEDHDMDEVASIGIVDRTDAAGKVEYRSTAYVSDASVGSAVLDGSIRSVIEELFDRLPATEFSSAAKLILDETWAEGVGSGRAFAALMLRLFGRYGLIVIDPLDHQIKRLASPIYQRAIERSDALVAGVVENNRKLAAQGFHTQVLVEEDHFPVFWHDDEGRRNPLRKAGPDLFRAKIAKRELTRDELMAYAAEDPGKLSPGVMLRPIVQDYLLPTVCYFGGAAEVAYFAQNSAVYKALDRPVTPILHRQSFTVIEPRQKRALDKLHLIVSDLFDGKDALALRTAEQLSSPDTARLFAEVEEVVSAQLERLDQALAATDPTLAANLATRRRKITYHIDTLRRKALLAALRRDETAEKRIDDLFVNLLPNGGLQERSLNVLVYLNKFGPEFIHWLYEAVDLDDKDHRIIEI